ncbi:MAG: hypothetical protein IJK64_07645 [Clostridia bacterium]|nr:hypothetical protein [Clostridia bacterium]
MKKICGAIKFRYDNSAKTATDGRCLCVRGKGSCRLLFCIAYCEIEAFNLRRACPSEPQASFVRAHQKPEPHGYHLWGDDIEVRLSGKRIRRASLKSKYFFFASKACVRTKLHTRAISAEIALLGKSLKPLRQHQNKFDEWAQRLLLFYKSNNLHSALKKPPGR